MLGCERVERRHGPCLDRRAGQHDDARFMAFEIDVDVIGAVAGDGVERAARVLVQFQIGIPRFRRGMVRRAATARMAGFTRLAERGRLTARARRGYGALRKSAKIR